MNWKQYRNNFNYLILDITGGNSKQKIEKAFEKIIKKHILLGSFCILRIADIIGKKVM